jgi:hypothetical protein
MKFIVLAFLLFGAPSGGKMMSLKDFDVSDGKITKASHGRLSTDSGEMRATLRTKTEQSATITFTFLGRGATVSALADGEVRYQIGLKMESEDVCNLLYVMWDLNHPTLRVSVKQNPGMNTSAECHDHGYVNLTPTVERQLPTVMLDSKHTLEATLTGNKLTAWADGVVVWEGENTVNPRLNGVLGIRTDNLHVDFDYEVNE